jgi:hypothetical protein
VKAPVGKHGVQKTLPVIGPEGLNDGVVGSSPTFSTVRLRTKHVDVVVEAVQDGGSIPP